MALLSQLLSGQQQNPFAQYQQMQANPFTQQIPGSEYLGIADDSIGGANAFGAQSGQVTPDMGVPTDFAGAPPGLPNLPENLQGFGFGQNSPQMNVNSNLRQDLIKQLLTQLMQQSGGGMMGGGF